MAVSHNNITEKNLLRLMIDECRNGGKKPNNLLNACVFHDTLFCNFYFTTAKFGLLDVLHTEVTAAVSVDLGFVPWGGLIVGAVGVGCSCEMENTKGDYCGKKKTYKRANYEM